MPEPSVGDLLSTARRHAQQLLNQADTSEAIALAAGWRHVLDSAAAVLAAMPMTVVGNEPAAADESYLATRVAAMAAATQRLSVPAARPHPGMVRIGDTLTQAADLVRRHAHDGMTRTPATRADLQAARVQIALTLATGAHTISRELRTYAQALQAADRSTRGRPAPRPLSLSQATRWVRLAQDQEQVALDYLTRHPGATGRGPAAVVPASPIGVQLARWSTTLIRHAADPQASCGDLRQIAAGQAWALHAATGLTLAAAELVQVHPLSAPLLIHRLQDAAVHWSATAQAWARMTTPDRPEPTPAVLAATNATIATVNGVLRAHNAWASPAQIAARLEGTAVPPLLHTITETSQILADCFQQLPAELSAAGRLRAPARALLDLEKEHHQRQAASTGQPDEDPSPEALSVNLRDVATNRLLPLTPTARQVLHEGGVQLTHAAHAAHAAVGVNAPQARAGHELTPATLRSLATSPLRAQPPPEGPRRPQPGPGVSP